MSLLKIKPLVLERRIAILVIGSATGIIGTDYFEEWLNYISYAVILTIGYLSLTKKNALINGTLYSTALYFTNFLFIANSYSYYLYIISFALVSLAIGAILGVSIAYIGYSVSLLTRKKR